MEVVTTYGAQEWHMKIVQRVVCLRNSQCGIGREHRNRTQSAEDTLKPSSNTKRGSKPP